MKLCSGCNSFLCFDCNKNYMKQRLGSKNIQLPSFDTNVKPIKSMICLICDKRTQFEIIGKNVKCLTCETDGVIQ